MSDFEHRSQEELDHDRIMLVLGTWGIFLTLILSPLPIALVIIAGVTLVAKDDVSRTAEWLLRNKACRKSFWRTSWDLATYPVRRLNYYLYVGFWPTYKWLDKHPKTLWLLGVILGTLTLFGLILALTKLGLQSIGAL